MREPGTLPDDVLDSLDDDSPTDEDSPLGASPGLFVCDHVEDDGSLCGSTWDTAPKLRMHKAGKHRDRSQDKTAAPRGTARKRKDTRPSHKDRKPSQTKAAATASGPSTNRADTYTQSIALIALGAHLALPKFDEYDLGVVNAGAPNLGSALAAVGDQNPAVQKAMDLVLGGGSGGAYLALLMAASSIAMPIMAHHGMVPNSTGQRFGGLAGVPPDLGPTPTPETPPGPESGSPVWDPANMDAGQLMDFMQQVPPNVFFDLQSKVMSGDGATVVGVPFGVTPQSQEDPGGNTERGSEQPAPEPVPVP